MKIQQHTNGCLMGQRTNKEGNKKFLWINKNGNTANSNLWDALKSVLRGKFISSNAYV